MNITQNENFKRIEILNKLSKMFRSIINKLKTHRKIHNSNTNIFYILKKFRLRNRSFVFKYLRFENFENNLFQSNYNHVDQNKKTINIKKKQRKKYYFKLSTLRLNHNNKKKISKNDNENTLRYDCF